MYEGGKYVTLPYQQIRSSMSATELYSCSFQIEWIIGSKTEKEKQECPKQNVRAKIFAKIYCNDTNSELFENQAPISMINQVWELKNQASRLQQQISKIKADELKLRDDIRQEKDQLLREAYRQRYVLIVAEIKKKENTLQAKQKQIAEIKDKLKNK